MKSLAQDSESIAIVGMSCRFPRAADAESYWRLLRDGVCARREVPPDRWSAEEYFDPDVERPGRMVATAGSFIDGVYDFDAGFFGVSPREALSMDPQQRLLLEVAADAFDLAGETRERLASSRVGVFVGVMNNDYSKRYVSGTDLSAADAYHLTGNWYSFLPGRIAYAFGLRGPVMAVDGACASSLVAVHLACKSLARGECDLAIAGGVSLILSPELSIVLSKAGTLAPDGLSKAFDASADGLGRGEGVGLVVLQRHSNATSDGKHVHALIRGSAVNHGGRSGGFTVPSGRAQEELLRQALADAGCEPNEIDYLEAHGTGTKLGDPIEARAVGAVFADRDRPLKIGSVKTNIGHLDSAAGVAGLIKVVLGLEHRQIPPQLHFKTPNPEVPWDELKLAIATELTDWQPGPDGVRRAGVSAFGMSGINAHVIVEQAPERVPAPAEAGARGPWVLPISAESPEALRESATRHASWLKGDAPAIANAAYSMALRRNHYKQRLAVLAPSSGIAAERLDEWLATGSADGVFQADASSGEFQSIGFCFCGQGAQWTAMGARLMEESATFRDAIRECESRLAPHVDFRLTDVLRSSDASKLEATALAQPALFAVEVALARLLRSYGVSPAAVVGHSVGEIAAAHVAGYLELGDAARLVATRGRLMQRFTGRGAMTLARATSARLAEMLARQPTLSIAAENNPEGVVASGPVTAIEAFEAACGTNGIEVRRLKVNYAFHHPALEEIRDEFLEAIGDVRARPGDVEFVSTVTGAAIDAEDLTPEYWFRNLREPVLFARATRALLDDGIRIFVEVGPHPVLSADIMRCGESGGTQAISIPTISRGKDDLGTVRRVAARLFTLGAPLDWSALQSENAQLVRPPTYPYQRTTFVHAHAPVAASRELGADPLLGPGLELAGQARDRVWQRELVLAPGDFLEQHRVGESVVFPGSGYVEMFLRAARKVGVADSTLGAIEFREPLLVGRELIELQTRATGQPNGDVELSLASRRRSSGAAEPWVTHARARLAVVVQRPGRADAHAGFAALRTMSGRLRIERVRARAGENYGQDEHYARMVVLGMNYGPLFRAVTQVWRSEAEALVQLAAPARSGNGRAVALLDACLQAAAVVIPRDSAGTYLPVAIGSVHAHAPELPDAVLCHAEVVSHEPSKQIVVNVAVFAPDGMLLLELREVRIVAVSHVERLRTADLGYRVEWVPSRRSDSAGGLGESVVLMDDGAGYGDQLRRELERRGTRVIHVESGPRFEVLGPDRYAVSPTSLECFNALFTRGTDALRSPVVHLWSLRPHGVDVALEAANNTASVLRLLQSRLISGASAAVPLWVVTRGAQAFGTEAEPSRALQAPVWGLLRSARLEVPQLRAASVDLDTNWDALQASRGLAAELVHSAGEPEVILRRDGRFAPRLRRTSLIFEAKAPRGTYLITGGLGGLGLEVAKSLAADGVDGIALLGRSAPGTATAAAIAELERCGVRVTTHRVDVADAVGLEAVLADVERRLGKIRGVVHAAGVVDDAALMRMDWERLTRVLSPKLRGAWNLHQLTLRRELDQFVLFSSASSLLGNAGQANYAAANAFLDALAEHRRGVGLPALTINWGAWREVGMLARAGDVSRMLERRGLAGMSTDEAVAAFRQALGSPGDRLAIMRLAPDQWLAENPLAPREFMAELATSEDGRRAPQRQREEALKRTPGEAFEFVQEHLTRMLGQVTGLAVKQLEPHVPFDKFGLDSLMGVEFKNRIDAAFELELSVSALWSFPRIDGLARHVVELLGIDLGATDGQAEDEVDAAALQRIADLLPTADAVELS